MKRRLVNPDALAKERSRKYNSKPHVQKIKAERIKAYRKVLRNNKICTMCFICPVEPNKLRCIECSKKQSITKKKRVLRQKQAVMDHYGNKCACCGEGNIKFLTVDHIDGGGNLHRKTISSGAGAMCRYLVKNNFPDGFQMLCWNCNCGKAMNGGVCPHLEYQPIDVQTGIVII
jgi:hypothetical protein